MQDKLLDIVLEVDTIENLSKINQVFKERSYSTTVIASIFLFYLIFVIIIMSIYQPELIQWIIIFLVPMFIILILKIYYSIHTILSENIIDETHNFFISQSLVILMSVLIILSLITQTEQAQPSSISLNILVDILQISLVQSINIKLYLYILLSLSLVVFIYWQIKNFDLSRDEILSQCLLFGQMIINIIVTTVQIQVHKLQQEEMNERIQISHNTMHNLRNYMQNIKDNLENDGDKESNKMILTENITYTFNRINFLYQIGLICESKQKIKILSITTSDLIHNCADLINIVYKNSANQIVINVQTNIKFINLDDQIFQYFMIELIRSLQIIKQEINIDIDFDQSDSYFLLRISLLTNNSKQIDDFINKHKFIFKLINNIHTDINLETKNSPEYLQQIIKIKNDISLFESYSQTNSYRVGQSDEKVNEQYEKKLENKIISESKVVDIDVSIYVNNQVHHSLTVTNNNLQVNIDDEYFILKMNSRVFSKFNITLATVKNGHQLFELFAFVSSMNPVPTIHLFTDHMLDRELGQEVLGKAKVMSNQLGLNVQVYLLSSSEDTETLYKQEKLGVKQFLTKPLNIEKLSSILQN